LCRYEPKTVVLLGDIKHDFRRSRYEARAEVTSVIELLADAAEVVPVRGNHDNFLQNIMSDMDLMAVDYVDMNGFRLEHGHVDSGVRPVIIGHEHPSVRIPGVMSGGMKLQCFVHAKKDGVIVLPPFSPMSSGNDLVPGEGSVMAPALRSADHDDADIYGISDLGLMPLGKLRDVLELSI
jgi:uncharacterized protein